MEAITIPTANAMPAPTWHRLHVNDVDIELPGGLEAVRRVKVSPHPPSMAAGDLWEEAFVRAADMEVFPVEPMSVPTSAAHQVDDQGSHSAAMVGNLFATGMGSDASEYLAFVAGEPLVFATEPGEHTCATVSLEGVNNSVNAAAIDVIAAPNSQLSLAISLDSPAPGTGVVGTRLRVFADENAQVDVTTTQTLDDTWIALDDTGALLSKNARLNVRHTVLGAGRAYTGLAADLRGDDAHLNVTTRYAGQADQLRDFNYAITQRGRRTRANLEANGVLAGASQKTLRGTIDLVHGCKGSEGSERETVLLADERVENRTVPVILCSEDDVAGNHGATIGHVRPEQLFYLASRGIAPEAAERLFMVAAFEQAALETYNERTREAVARLATAHNIDLEEVTA